jgi:proline iminopeptidase
VTQATNVAGLAANLEVNRVLGADAARLVEGETFRAQLPSFPVDTLVVHGEADPRPLWATHQLAELIPTSRFVTIPRCGHFPWVEQPDTLRPALRSFLANLRVNAPDA